MARELTGEILSLGVDGIDVVPRWPRPGLDRR
jgi:hypothetical protein